MRTTDKPNEMENLILKTHPHLEKPSVFDIPTDSPLSLTGKHHESLTNLYNELILDPKGMHSKHTNTKPTASLFSSISNLTNSIIGAGILGLPFAMSKAGISVAIFLVLFFSLLTFIGLYFLMYSSKHFPIHGHSSFYNISFVFLPKPFRKLMDYAVAINCFGHVVAYLMISVDMFTALANQFTSANSILVNRQLLLTAFLFTFVLPMVRFKYLDSFKYASLIAVLCFIWITTIIILYALFPTWFVSTDHIHQPEPVHLNMFPMEFVSFASILPIYTFGFFCHQNAFSITNELANNSMKRLNTINITTLLIVCVIYLLVSFCSYYTFGEYVESDILNNYPTDSFVFALTRFALVIAILFSIPTAYHPTRDSISAILFNLSSDKLNNAKYNILTYSIVLCAYCFALILNDLALVLSVIGATAGAIISYIYPGLLYYYMFKDNPTHKISVYMAIFLTVFGFILMSVCIVCIFISKT
eukprot:491378_1